MNKVIKKLLLTVPIVKRKYYELENLNKDYALLRNDSVKNTNWCKVKTFKQIPANTEIEIEHRMRNYTQVVTDITTYCNARCIFCINGVAKIHDHTTKEQFAKSIEILPLVSNHGYLFSCGWEPTVNPNFIEFLEMIPERYKRKVFFTTNLVKFIPDEMFHRLANAAVSFINVSLETFDNELYKRLTKTEQSSFFDNLDRMVHIFSRYTCSPNIRFITLILRDNHDELLSLVKIAKEKYRPIGHEFRTPYVFSNTSYSNEMTDQFLPRSSIDDIVAKISALSYTHLDFCVEGDLETYNASLALKKNEPGIVETQENDPVRFFTSKDSYNFNARIEPNGQVSIEGFSELFELKEINDPYSFFQKKLSELQKKVAMIHADCDQSLLKSLKKSDKVHGRLEQICIYDAYFMVFTFKIWMDNGIGIDEKGYIIINKSILFKLLRKSMTEAKPALFDSNVIIHDEYTCCIDLREIELSDSETISVEVAALDNDILLSTTVAEIPVH